ncbi:MarR family winged helix-turn-helix transcriptional regulator [Inquilinus sp. Marseille-Q2685]|uniref:MarR family winged helix-turn-helix transcriptional regulator n=1 Tax=Inquilinus sp. Marseille-Q2685 TaxID=2866581 RepID=UPI001CE48B96|nr:MarR family winged helix-turn-helix transcriptional regulator [Inquilinus sp. Marseille-Q2685]
MHTLIGRATALDDTFICTYLKGMPLSQTLDAETADLIARTCLCQHVQRAGRIIGRRFDEAFRSLGINNWQFSVLIALKHLRSPTIGELAETLGMDRTTLTKNLKPLARRGLLDVSTDERDARARRIALTEAGEEILAGAKEGWQQAQQAVTAGFPPEELAQLTASLERFRPVDRG